MSRGGARPGAGRKAGGKNSRTIECEQKLAEINKKAIEALGIDAFEGNAHAFLVTVYKDKSLNLQLRIDAAKAAISYEKPKLSSIALAGDADAPLYVVSSPADTEGFDEWQKKHAPLVGGSMCV